MGYTHFDGIAGKKAVAVGTKGKEVIIASVEDPVVKTKVFRINHKTTGLAAGVELLTLQPGQAILSLSARVTEAWTTGTTAKLSIGHSTGKEYVKEGDAKSTGLLTLETGIIPTAVVTAKTAVKVKVVEDGTASTKGKAEVTIMYLDNIL